MPDQDEESLQKIKKRNRIRRLSPKKHKITHEHGRSIKELYRKITKAFLRTSKS